MCPYLDKIKYIFIFKITQVWMQEGKYGEK